jgi:hypothetical protein
MYYPFDLKYSINAFKTKQVLDKSYQKYTEDFNIKKWSGEYNSKFDKNLIEKILEAFEKDREKHFDLIHKTDYRYVYKSRNLPVEIYLKLYKTWEASYSKFTIIKRNILRRTLAKKAFALSFKLEEMKIPTVESIFYAKKGRAYIPNESIYVSLAVENTIPISYYFETLNNRVADNNFTDSFKEEVKILDENLLKERYLNFIKLLIENGLRGFYREFEGNTLIKYKNGNDFELLLCDLDIIDAILEFDAYQKKAIFESVESSFEKLIKSSKNI